MQLSTSRTNACVGCKARGQLLLAAFQLSRRMKACQIPCLTAKGLGISAVRRGQLEKTYCEGKR